MTTNPPIELDSRPAAIEGEVSPRTRGLAVFIQEAVAQLRKSSRENNAASSDGLLFLGNWHDSHPRLLFHDPVLEPVDKIVWTVVRHHADIGDATGFPSYQAIARLANIGSKATVARAIMILRITRWMSLCARVRDEKGRFQGNVYALHDEPIAVGDAMYLDPEYIQFLHEMQHHHHDRVKRVAAAVLATIEEAIDAGSDVTRESTLHQQHARRLAAQRRSAKYSTDSAFSVSGQALQASLSPEEGLRDKSDRSSESTQGDQNLYAASHVQDLNLARDDGVQNLNADSEAKEKQSDSARVQILNSVPVCSSSFLNIKTTTTTAKIPQAASKQAPRTEERTWDELHFPPQLSADEAILARMYLSRIPGDEIQDILDELQGRLGNAVRSGPPIQNPIGYLVQLCNAAKTDAFKLTSVGLQVRQVREQTAVRERAQGKAEQRHRQELLATPLSSSRLVERLKTMRQHAHGRQRKSRQPGGQQQSGKP